METRLLLRLLKNAQMQGSRDVFQFSLRRAIAAREAGETGRTLSGGEQQALAISRALVKRPDILLLDEPTTGLMPLFVSKLMEIIKKLNEQGMAILLVEEKIPFALGLAHRVYFMVKGKTEFHAPIEEIRGKKETLIRYLGVEV